MVFSAPCAWAFRSRRLRAPRGSVSFLPSGQGIPEHSLPSLGILLNLLDDTATALRRFDIERTAPKPRSGSEPSPGVDSHHPEHHHRRGSRPKPSLGGRSGAKATNTASPLLSAAVGRCGHDTAGYSLQLQAQPLCRIATGPWP